ncbi:hypothetical protein GF382_02025 [Candidatus Falkowbacteria bacterium]|nr:hypothetical protein [Candidatus Falkowbacteria bacterium]
MCQPRYLICGTKDENRSNDLFLCVFDIETERKLFFSSPREVVIFARSKNNQMVTADIDKIDPLLAISHDLVSIRDHAIYDELCDICDEAVLPHRDSGSPFVDDFAQVA